jgi:hypothetical protein
LAYQTDIRAWDETKEWRLMVMAGDQDVTLSWDGRAVPLGQCLTLRRLDPLGQPLGVSVANLSHTGSITVPAGRSSLYAISLGWSTVSFHLKPGWNSLSLPLEPKVGSVAALFADADGRSASDGGSVWTWRDGGYVSVTQVRPFEGYWVFSPAATSCTVVGSPVEDTTYQLRKGWTLVGPAAVLAAPALPTLQGLWWTWEGRTYVPAQTLLPTRAYWVYVSAEATTVELGE